MSESLLKGEEIHEETGDPVQPVLSDEEDDCEGYFLEPVGGNVNIAEKIAEANKKLLEEAEDNVDKNRPRKVQFSEDLVNFEPIYYSDDDCTESAQNSVISEEDSDIKLNQDEPGKTKAENDSVISTDSEKKSEEEILEEIPEEIDTEVISMPSNINDDLSEKNPKFILVLLPKEQNSSCESIIGEEVAEEKKDVKSEEKAPKPKITRPKSAKKSCEVSKISPNLNCSSNIERRSWQTKRCPLVKAKTKAEGNDKKDVFVGEIKVQIKGRLLKKINIDDLTLENVPKVETLKRCSCNRPKSSYTGRKSSEDGNRPKTAPMRRTCCVIKTELPVYNGLRSEYGLSAEQLLERKQKAIENRQKKKMEKMKKRQEEIRKKNENEETFQKWLFNKTKKSLKKKSPKLTDTLTRSDVYIQTHASYAANRGVPYSLDYSITKKGSSRKRNIRGKKNKTIMVEKLLNDVTPHFKRSFNIYLGVSS